MNDSNDKPLKKPLWPFYLIALMLAASAVVLFKDWKRYPTASELEGYLELSYASSKNKVVVTGMEECTEEGETKMVYKLDYLLENGEVKKDSFSIKDENRKSIYPWHNYYRTQKKITNAQKDGSLD